MSVGSVLVGVAVALVTAAYLARPFRVASRVNSVGGSTDLDRTIESWVAQVRAERAVAGHPATRADRGAESISFCPQCGRRVGSGDRFCAGCGTRLERE